MIDSSLLLAKNTCWTPGKNKSLKQHLQQLQNYDNALDSHL